MSRIGCFEDIIAWQKARELNKQVYKTTQQRDLSQDFGLKSQLQRASVSIMANIAEGFERNKRGEFHQYLSTAKASCAEVRSHLYAAFDAGYLGDAQFQTLMEAAQEVGRILGGLRSSVAQQRNDDQHN